MKTIREPIGESGHVLISGDSLILEDQEGGIATFNRREFDALVASVIRLAARAGLAERTTTGGKDGVEPVLVSAGRHDE